MPELARPGDPYVDETGQITETLRRADNNYEINVPIARNLVSKSPRSVRELGADAQTQTVIGAVLVYHVAGVSKNEIAHVIGATPQEVEHIINLPAFQETFEILFNELVSAQSQSIQARIASYAGRAFDNMMDLADAKPRKEKVKDATGVLHEKLVYDVSPKVILQANEGVLDRAGLSADALFGKQAQSAAPDLEIVVTSAESGKTDIKVKMR